MRLIDYIYNHDLQFKRVSEHFKVVSPILAGNDLGFSVSDYLYGRCDIFALTLMQMKKLELGIFVAGTGDDFEYLCHAFCYFNDDLLIDAQGIRTRSEIRDRYFCDFEVHTELRGNSANEALDHMGLFSQDRKQKDEINALKRYIRQMDRFGLFVPGEIENECQYAHRTSFSMPGF